MKSVAPSVAVLLIALFASAPLKGAEEKSAAAGEFDVASIRFEQNATDGDVEAVFEAVGDDDGLASLSITAPDGRKIVEFTSPGKSAMGIREFHFESPEPTDVAALKKAFPEGQYAFAGSKSSGEKLQGKSTLSHNLPPTTAFVSPKADARNVSAKNLKITWAPVKGVAGYTLELSPSKSSAHIDVKLPASTTSFAVPDGFLVPGGECQLGIGTVSSAGNVSVIETTFTTATGK
jgi:hypothetical protein